MKRRALLRHLRDHGCELVREGSRHFWWHNPKQNRRSAVPRHTEIVDVLADKICGDLGIPSQNEIPVPRNIELFRRNLFESEIHSPEAKLVVKDGFGSVSAIFR